MIYYQKHRCRILTSGLLMIIVTLLSVNVGYYPVTAATTRKSTNSENGYMTQSPETCQEICQSPECYSTSNALLAIINRTVDPCDDFYEFTCGNFVNSQTVSDVSSIINTFTIAQTLVATELFYEIKKDISEDDLDAFKKTKRYYQNCMNQDRIESEGTRPLFDILKYIGGWPVLLREKWKEDEYDWKNVLFKIQDLNFIIFFPFITSVSIDKMNSSKRIVRIENADTVISRAFFLDKTDNTELLKAYHNYMINISVALGAYKNVAFNDMKKVVDFEVKLFKIKTPPEELINQTDNQISIKEISQRFPSIPWLELINKILGTSGITLDENEIVSVADLKFITEVEKLINVTPKRVLANYLALRVIQFTLMYMPERLRKIASEFSNLEDGTKKMVNRESWCLDELMQAFPNSLSALYVREYFDKKKISGVVTIIQNIKHQIKRNLREIDWMDDSTRKAALEKLEAIQFSVGYAVELMNDQKVNEFYKELEINSGSYLQSAFNITTFIARQTYRTLRKPENTFWMIKNVAYINAYSMLQRNAIDIPAGFLRFFFITNIPKYVNYATVGSTIGHEIMHGFDTEGRKYDKYGNLHNWWDSDTEAKFFNKAKCLIEQYNNYTVPEIGLQLNGIMTQGENIADNGGFKAAYHAYKNWIDRNNITEPCLPNLNFSQKQLFWISAASIYCSKERPEYLRNIIATGQHSPGKARVTVSFSNFKEFAEDFDCKLGSRMNPQKKCIIW